MSTAPNARPPGEAWQPPNGVSTRLRANSDAPRARSFRTVDDLEPAAVQEDHGVHERGRRAVPSSTEEELSLFRRQGKRQWRGRRHSVVVYAEEAEDAATFSDDPGMSTSTSTTPSDSGCATPATLSRASSLRRHNLNVGDVEYLRIAFSGLDLSPSPPHEVHLDSLEPESQIEGCSIRLLPSKSAQRAEHFFDPTETGLPVFRPLHPAMSLSRLSVASGVRLRWKQSPFGVPVFAGKLEHGLQSTPRTPEGLSAHHASARWATDEQHFPTSVWGTVWKWQSSSGSAARARHSVRAHSGEEPAPDTKIFCSFSPPATTIPPPLLRHACDDTDAPPDDEGGAPAVGRRGTSSGPRPSRLAVPARGYRRLAKRLWRALAGCMRLLSSLGETPVIVHSHSMQASIFHPTPRGTRARIPSPTCLLNVQSPPSTPRSARGFCILGPRARIQHTRTFRPTYPPYVPPHARSCLPHYSSRLMKRGRWGFSNPATARAALSSDRRSLTFGSSGSRSRLFLGPCGTLLARTGVRGKASHGSPSAPYGSHGLRCARRTYTMHDTRRSVAFAYCVHCRRFPQRATSSRPPPTRGSQADGGVQNFRRRPQHHGGPHRPRGPSHPDDGDVADSSFLADIDGPERRTRTELANLRLPCSLWTSSPPPDLPQNSKFTMRLGAGTRRASRISDVGHTWRAASLAPFPYASSPRLLSLTIGHLVEGRALRNTLNLPEPVDRKQAKRYCLLHVPVPPVIRRTPAVRTKRFSRPPPNRSVSAGSRARGADRSPGAEKIDTDILGPSRARAPPRSVPTFVANVNPADNSAQSAPSGTPREFVRRRPCLAVVPERAFRATGDRHALSIDGAPRVPHPDARRAVDTPPLRVHACAMPQYWCHRYANAAHAVGGWGRPRGDRFREGAEGTRGVKRARPSARFDAVCSWAAGERRDARGRGTNECVLHCRDGRASQDMRLRALSTANNE
ncbi:uncharacterized protein BXZ73DRAFT_75834 [Epithele typhae]|uniref:uncharacterized protein n=1 Tax=Epithele typhae TaxID=378194 RepID=UPI0020088DC7|nr:uncharacterized protein BXZ73DRAFT_75834 [Epithele typhae]KAH9939630.1 hypothetical protein BXZ73DRAFT_75834 [Epithele typhae]